MRDKIKNFVEGGFTGSADTFEKLSEIRFETNVNTIKWLPGLLLAASIVYLLFEFNLNSLILNAIDHQQDALNVANYGRVVAAIGASLFTARFMLNVRVYTFVGWALTTGIVVYFLQMQILDMAVDNTTDTERKAAQHLVLLQSAMLSEIAVLPNLNKNISNDKTSYKAFTSMLAFSSWGNPEHLKVVRDNMPQVLTYRIDKEINGELERDYAKFVNSVQDQIDKFKGSGVQRRNLEQKIDNLVGEHNQEINQLLKGLSDNQGGGAMFDVYETKYIKAINKVFPGGKYLPWQGLCNKVEIEEMRSFNGELRSYKKERFDCTNISAVQLSNRIRVAVGLPGQSDDMTFKDKANSVVAQDELRSRLNITDKTKFIKFDMNFDEYVVLMRETTHTMMINKALEEVEMPVAQLNDQGREYVRMVMIVPLALSFSLLFSILNAAVLLKRPFEKLPVLLNNLPTYFKNSWSNLSKEQNDKYFAYVDRYTDFSTKYGSLIALPVILTVLFSVALLTGSTNGIVGGLSGIIIQFVIGAENFIYPVGNIFN